MPTTRPRRATINDVARLAGVSKGAVSRSMNGGERLSPDTVARVKAAAEELGWRPNAAARSINGAPAHVLGFVVNRGTDVLDSDPFFGSFIQGVEMVAMEHEHSLMIRFVRDADSEVEAYRTLVDQSQVAGFLVTDLRIDDPRFPLLAELGMPTVAVGSPPADWGVWSVDHDPAEAIDGLAEELAALGHRHVGHVAGDPTFLHSLQRHRCFEQACERNGLRRTEAVQHGYSSEAARRATRTLMALDDAPTAIFYPNDTMAAIGVTELERLGKRVSGDVSVAGFDGSSLSNLFRPRLTTIECDYVNLGRQAALRVLELAAGRTPGDRHLALTTRFSPRESTGRVASAK